MLLRPLALIAVSGSLAMAAGCSAAPERAPSPDEPVASTSQGLSTTDALARAEQWVAAKLLYCQSANGKPDGDTACASTCVRESNPEWDPYRSDCSGFIAWAWNLPAPGRVTGEFAPYETDITTVIQAIDLRPGDAANRNSGGHIVLFEKWTTPGSEAVFMEEPGCSSSTPYAHEFTSAVTIDGSNITIAYEGEAFTAIRYGALTTNEAPIGSLDSASCTAIVGWSQDGDTPTAANSVALSFDAPATEADAGALTTVVANIDRSDLCTPLGSCDHGFDVPMPAALKDGKAHEVYAYGIDAQTGDLALLTSAPKSFTCAKPVVPVDAGKMPSGSDGGTSTGNGETEAPGGGFPTTSDASTSSGGCAMTSGDSSRGGAAFGIALAIAALLVRRRR